MKLYSNKEYHTYGNHELILEYSHDGKHPMDPDAGGIFVENASLDGNYFTVPSELYDTDDRDDWSEYLINAGMITEADSVIDFVESAFMKKWRPV